MGLFHEFNGAQAILRTMSRGVFKQVKVYERDAELYASEAGGYIRLLANGKTSHPGTCWEFIDTEFDPPTRISGGIRPVGKGG